MRVVATSPLPIDLATEIRSAIPEALVETTPLERADLETVDALVCLLTDKIDTQVLERAPRLKIVANCAVGVDNIDLDACRSRGVAVSNTPDVLTEATAEFAFLLALACARRLGEGERLVRSKQWTGWALDQLLGTSLVGKTLGIVGFGRIGRALARRAAGFGMSIIYASHSSYASYERVELDDLFRRADVISLHVPLTEATRRMIDRRRLQMCKPGVILVNTSRGGVVDEDALFEALEFGWLHGAGLDVYMHEPEIDERFYTCPRLVLAPHIGSATTETRTAMAKLCSDAVIDVLSGRRPHNLVVG